MQKAVFDLFKTNFIYFINRPWSRG